MKKEQTKASATLAAKEASQWKKWLQEPEAAGYLGISPVTLRKWREKGETSKGEDVPRCFKRGVQYYYSIAELDRWITGGTAYGGTK